LTAFIAQGLALYCIAQIR